MWSGVWCGAWPGSAAAVGRPPRTTLRVTSRTPARLADLVDGMTEALPGSCETELNSAYPSDVRDALSVWMDPDTHARKESPLSFSPRPCTRGRGEKCDTLTAFVCENGRRETIFPVPVRFS